MKATASAGLTIPPEVSTDTILSPRSALSLTVMLTTIWVLLLEMIRFALICRRCELAPCVKACPNDALEKVASERNDAGILVRHNMLCTACGTCAVACPFGTIYTDLIPYPSSVCDRCEGRLNDGEKPLCVQTCSDQSIEYGEVANGDDMAEVFDGIVVKVAGGMLWEPFLRDNEKV